MSRAAAAPLSTKISDEFARRLAHLPAGQSVRAVVMLDTGGQTEPSGRRGRGQRQAAVAAVRNAADAALPELDTILVSHQGRRLAAHADSLGCIPIEATPETISALVASNRVKAIFEDQPISLISR